MIKSELLFERLPPNNLNVEAYSVSAANDAANNGSARYFNAPRHSNLKGAIDHLITQIAAGKKRIGISGHGIDGYVETGGGAQGSYDRAQYVSRSNQMVWGPEIERLFEKNFNDFFIYSCSTGAGTYGAYLLWLLARHMEKPVYARTGLLYIVTQGSKVWLETEKGATWQKATGDMLSPPDPIESPKSYLNFKNKIKGFEYQNEDPGAIIFFSNIEQIKIVKKEGVETTVPKNSSDTFLEQLFDSEAIELAGDIMGTITAIIQVTTPNETIVLEIYCDRVAKIQHQNIIYFIGEQLREMIVELTKG